MIAMQNLTHIEHKLVEELSDGRPHCQAALVEAIDETGLMSINQLRVYLTGLRKKLPPGELIVNTKINRQTHYQHVRHLASPYDGRT